MFNSKSRAQRSFAVALLVSAAVISSCGGTSTSHTRNAALCSAGGACKVGDTGPGGGLIISVDGTNYVELAPANWNNGQDDPAPDNLRDVPAMLSSTTINGIRGWTLPTLDQMYSICQLATGLSGSEGGDRHCAGTFMGHSTNFADGFKFQNYATANTDGADNFYEFNFAWGVGPYGVSATGYEIHVRPIRAFTLSTVDTTVPTTEAPPATDSTTTTIEPSTTVPAIEVEGVQDGLVHDPTDMTYKVYADHIQFTWKNNPDGLAPTFRAVEMIWEWAHGGGNCLCPLATTDTTASVPIYPTWYGTWMTFDFLSMNWSSTNHITRTTSIKVIIPSEYSANGEAVTTTSELTTTSTEAPTTTASPTSTTARSTSTAPTTSESPTKTEAPTTTVGVTSTSEEPTTSTSATTEVPMVTAPTVPLESHDQPVVTQILKPESPFVDLGPSQITQTVASAEVLQAVSSLVPEGQTATAVEVTFDDTNWIQLAPESTSTEVVIPTSARGARVRITTSTGQKITINKLFVRTVRSAADHKYVQALAGGTSNSGTGSGSNHVWLIIALAALLLVVLFGGRTVARNRRPS